MNPTDQLTALLVGLFNIALRPQGKVMSARLVEQLRAAICDAVVAGDPIYDLLDEIPPYRGAAPRQLELDTRVTQVLERGPRPQDADPQYRAWQEQRRQRAHSDDDQAALGRMLRNGNERQR